jgi:hypothetical protein
MSALGQKRTLRLASPMSALPPKADIARRPLDVRFGPIPDIAAYSITSSARASGIGGISRDQASLRRFDPYFFARSIT